MTPSQLRQCDRIRAFLETQRNKNPEYKDEITRFEVTEVSDITLVFVSADIVMTGLPAGNLLRAVSAQYWTFCIWPRGRTEVNIAPEAFEQFNGRKAFDFYFKLD